MATKTFEELKQLAIQIRDEKTNKQNTATRVGTAMLEHINKLEQDYYDKTQTDEELKKRDDKLTELSNNVGLYNVDKNVPLGIGFYTSTTARAAVPTSVRKLGLIITYKTDATTSVTEQFIGSNVSGWATDTNWKNVGSEGGNKILEWNTDVATTRKQVPEKERKPGMQISYTSDGENWTNEQFIGTTTDDTSWSDDNNWELLPNDTYIKDLYGEYVDTAEYLMCYTDSEGRFLFGIKSDGSIEWSKGVPTPIKDELKKLNESVYNQVLPGLIEVTLDAEGRILSYRDTDGIKHEQKGLKTPNVETDNLTLSKNGIGKFVEALNEYGYSSKSPIDWSDEKFVEVPIPNVSALVRINAPILPTTKTDNIEGTIEFWDKNGNYFKKPIILNAQGSSSLNFFVKNLAIDLDDDSKIKFGKWVAQDSFHIKKYYIDVFRGQSIVAYRLMEQVYRTRPYGDRRPWDYLNKNTSILNSFGEVSRDFDTGAQGHPDGFPVVVYHNDTLMGLYSWNLKKDRDNYYAEKKNSKNIILDGILGENIWGVPDSIGWNQFEIRNPKGLIDIDGNDYDGDNPKEPSDTDSFSKEVKDSIVRLAGYTNDLDENKSKDTFEKYFNVPFFIDYYIVSVFIYHFDGFRKNWIWCTWDGLIWTPTLYDCDSIFGSHYSGNGVVQNLTDLGTTAKYPTKYLQELYISEIQERYAELRRKGIFSVDNIINLFEEWVSSCGYDNIKDDIELYPETPSYRDPKLNDGWELYSPDRVAGEQYSQSKTYNKNDMCYYGKNAEYCTFKATRDNIVGVPPVSDFYTKSPYVAGFFNSVSRIKNWIEERIISLDSKFNYNA